MNIIKSIEMLKRLNLPTLEVIECKTGNHLDPAILWTVETDIEEEQEEKFTAVGVNSAEARLYADTLRSEKDIKESIICYPFTALHISGLITVSKDIIFLEAFYTYEKLPDNRSLKYVYEKFDARGNSIEKSAYTLEDKDLYDSLLKYIAVIRVSKDIKQVISEGKIVRLEWEYAQKCSCFQKLTGDKYMVFTNISIS